MDFLEACKKLISLDSTPSQGTIEVVHYLKGLAEGMGFSVDIMEEVSEGVPQANILIRPNKKEQRLLLQTHLDTVDPGAFALWSKTGFNPFQPSIRGEKIYGLGTADVKLDFLCKLFALQSSRVSQMNHAAVLLGTFGEENQMRGAIKAVRERGVKATQALIGEPTDLNVGISGKGIARLEIIIPSHRGDEYVLFDDEITSSTQSKIFQGRAAHSSNPELGENAVMKMLDYLMQLPSTLSLVNIDGGTSFNTIPTQAILEFDLNAAQDDRPEKIRKIYKKIKSLEVEFKKYPDTRFTPAHPTINIGLIRTYEDHIRMFGAVRWSSHISEEKYTSWMQELGEVCRSQNSVLRVLDAKKPFSTKAGEFSQICLEEARQFRHGAELISLPVTTEANVFSRFGFECLVFGPGHRHNNSHTPEEHVSLGDLSLAQDFYTRVITRICS